MLRHPSASKSERPVPPLVLIDAFLIISLSIDWNLKGSIPCKGLFIKTSCQALLTFGSFSLSFESASLFSDNTSFFTLFVNRFNGELILPFARYY